MLVNFSLSASGDTELLIISMPVISTAKPIRMLPMSLRWLRSFAVIIIITPITARIGENEDGLSILTQTLLPSIAVRDSSHDVTVVPIFAPMMTPTAWVSFMIPELTKPTTMTVVAEDDWMIAVTPRPSRTAMKRFDVSFSKIFSSLPPESCLRPSPMTSIPYRNRARPPIKERIANMSITSPLDFSKSLLKIYLTTKYYHLNVKFTSYFV